MLHLQVAIVDSVVKKHFARMNYWLLVFIFRITSIKLERMPYFFPASQKLSEHNIEDPGPHSPTRST